MIRNIKSVLSGVCLGLVAGSASAGLIHENANFDPASIPTNAGELRAPVSPILNKGFTPAYSVTDLAKTIFVTNPVRLPEPSVLLLLVPALGALLIARHRAKR
jgi:hypothetical protein